MKRPMSNSYAQLHTERKVLSAELRNLEREKIDCEIQLILKKNTDEANALKRKFNAIQQELEEANAKRNEIDAFFKARQDEILNPIRTGYKNVSSFYKKLVEDSQKFITKHKRFIKGLVIVGLFAVLIVWISENNLVPTESLPSIDELRVVAGNIGELSGKILTWCFNLILNCIECFAQMW